MADVTSPLRPDYPADMSRSSAAGPGDVPTLRRLMQLYLYEIGSDDGWDIGAGRPLRQRRAHRAPSGPSRGRRAFLIRVGGVLAGFALVNDRACSPGAGTREISEFFVLRRYRRRGRGRARGHEAVRPVPRPLGGRPDGEQLPARRRSGAAVIARYTGGAFEDGERPTEDGGAPRAALHRPGAVARELGRRRSTS